MRLYLKQVMIFWGLAVFSVASCTQVGVPIRQEPAQVLAGQIYGVAYSGFRDGQYPARGDVEAVNPTPSQILEDLKILLNQTEFRMIRLYDSQVNSEETLKVIREHQLPIKVLLGAWLDAEISNHEGCAWLDEPIPQSKLDANVVKNKQELARLVKLANDYKDIVVAVNVGNEALVSWNDHMVSESSIIQYIQFVQNAIEQPVTTADNYEWWAQNGGTVAQVVEFLMIHTYPQWEGKPVADALAYTIENMEAVRDAHPGAMMVIGEAGWATTAREFGDRASVAKQKIYYQQLMNWATEHNISTFWFEAFDESWKGNPNHPDGAEKHWGLFGADRKKKH